VTRREPRLSHQTLLVLRAFLDAPREGLAGSDIHRATGMLSGTIYPILIRLEAAGWLKSRWEEAHPSEAARPIKRLYTLTAPGHNKAVAALRAISIPSGSLAWKS
jgi:DNA-binding PadR family transcriptional regulator